MNEWQEAVAELQHTGPQRSIHPAVCAYLESAVAPGSTLLLACSGGVDSVYLTLLMQAWAREHAASTAVLHYNHGVRGEDSAADARFVAEIAEALEVPFHLGNAPRLQAPSEAQMRQLRYQWMGACYAANHASALVLGQHADDACESLLMAILSGSGLAGLASPRPVTRFADGHVRLRPLLEIRRVEIERHMRGLGLHWREDASNAATRYTRNWLRHEILPRLEARFPQDIVAGTRRTRELMEEALEALDAEVSRRQLDLSAPDRVDLHPLRAAPRAVVRRAFMRWWLQHHEQVPFPKDCLEELLDQISGASPLAPLQVNASLRMAWQDPEFVLHLQSEGSDTARPWQQHCSWSPLSSDLFLPDGARLSAVSQRFARGSQPYLQADSDREAWLAIAPQPLTVRCWSEGDRFRPLGAPGRRKLQDLFTDAKIPRAQRANLPVICGPDGSIYWVPGFPPSQSLRLSPLAESALRLTYHPPLSPCI